MVNIDLRFVIKDIDGEALRDGDITVGRTIVGENMVVNRKVVPIDGTYDIVSRRGWEVTTRKIFSTALVSMGQKEAQSLSGDDKYLRGILLDKIMKAGATIDLTLEEAKLLKDLVGNYYGPLVVFQLWNILDPKTQLVNKEK